MSVKFRKFLAAEHEKARREDRLHDWCWIGGKCACWRPIKNYQTVKRGKKKGWFRIELFYPKNKKIIVLPEHTKFVEK